jgi:hypothetical protein
VCLESQGEKSVADTLQRLGVEFDREFKLPDCRNINPLPCDFVVWGDDGFPRFIEYQGEQHYRTTARQNKEQLKAVQARDAIKATFCRRLTIPLLQIPYWDKSRVPGLVENFVRPMNTDAMAAAV